MCNAAVPLLTAIACADAQERLQLALKGLGERAEAEPAAFEDALDRLQFLGSQEGTLHRDGHRVAPW